MHRPIPNNPEAESKFLACCMIDGATSVSLGLAGGVTPESFFEAYRGVIFALMLDMVSAGKPVTESTVYEELVHRKKLEEAGGTQAFFAIAASASTTADTAQLVKIITELSAVREAMFVAMGLVETCYQYAGEGVAEALGEPINRLLGISHAKTVREDSWGETIDKADALAGEMVEKKGKPLDGMIEFPWAQMNYVFGPMVRGQIVIIAARTSIGKSSLARPIACHAAKCGKHVYFDTLEVQPERVALQMAATLSRVGIRRLGVAHPAEQQDFRNALKSLRSAGITMSKRDRSLAQIVGRLTALARQGLVDLAIIDHGGYIDEIAKAKAGEKIAIIGQVTKTLKLLAVDLNIVIIMLWQLNRGSEKEGNREPINSDLKDSGNLEEDADKVLLIHRPSENPHTQQPQANTTPIDECPKFFQNIHQGKGRDEGTEFVSFYFDRATASFDPIQK